MTARISIIVARYGSASFIKQAYAEQPFKVADITEPRQAGELHLMLMTASPGVLEGDEYTIGIRLEPNSALRLTTQSYQRLFSMKNQARQQLTVHMAAGSFLVYLPQPVVPHAGSVFNTTNKVYLADNCTLTWAEILTCGRKLNGEQFHFSSYHSITEIFLQQKLVIKENLLMAPGKTEGVIQQLEGFTHQASMICLSAAYSVSEIKAAVSNYLLTQHEMLFGITSAPVNGIIIRMLGYKAEQLFDCVKNIAAILNSIMDIMNTPTANGQVVIEHNSVETNQTVHE